MNCGCFSGDFLAILGRYFFGDFLGIYVYFFLGFWEANPTFETLLGVVFFFCKLKTSL